LHVPVGSAFPAGTGEQVPTCPARLQDWQLPAQAVAQQTPWAHAPLLHSVAAAHPAPLALRPQEPFTQAAGATQSASDAHVDLHAELPH
jgi:hypothetical protein